MWMIIGEAKKKDYYWSGKRFLLATTSAYMFSSIKEASEICWRIPISQDIRSKGIKKFSIKEISNG